MNVMRQTAWLIVNRIMVNNFAALFNCTPAGRASDLMMAPAYKSLLKLVWASCLSRHLSQKTTGFCNSEMPTSNFVFLYVYRITSIFP